MEPEPKTPCTPLRCQLRRKRDASSDGVTGGWGNAPLRGALVSPHEGQEGEETFMVRVHPVLPVHADSGPRPLSQRQPCR